MIPGLYYFKDVVSDELSKEITTYLSECNDWFPVGGASNSRQVIHYGYKYNYKSGDVTEKAKPFPTCIVKLLEIIKQVADFQSEKDAAFTQCLINKYEPNQGIAPHIDSLSYGRYICCFTLGSGANLTFTNYGKTVDLYTEPNSLYIMSGEARYNWRHEMKKLKNDIVDGKKIPRGTRTSITFRSLKEN